MSAVAAAVLMICGFGLIIHTFEKDDKIGADAGAARVGLGALAVACGGLLLAVVL